eukprot:scaffold235612_cov24-Tisochrysis_lutea.AAC.1
MALNNVRGTSQALRALMTGVCVIELGRVHPHNLVIGGHHCTFLHVDDTEAAVHFCDQPIPKYVHVPRGVVVTSDVQTAPLSDKSLLRDMRHAAARSAVPRLRASKTGPIISPFNPLLLLLHPPLPL